MTAVIAWVKTFKYWSYVLAGVVVAVLGGLVKFFLLAQSRPKTPPASSQPEGTTPNFLPPIPPAIQQAADKAQEEALVARVQARVTAGAQVDRLDDVMKIDDGAVRRERLAEMLRGL